MAFPTDMHMHLPAIPVHQTETKSKTTRSSARQCRVNGSCTILSIHIGSLGARGCSCGVGCKLAGACVVETSHVHVCASLVHTIIMIKP
jgi:hypothetical protein